MTPGPRPAPIDPNVDAARRFCETRRITLLDLHESLDRALPNLVPEGHRFVSCGNCCRGSIVPTGAYLEALRKSCGLTRGQVAVKAGRSEILIGDVERERRNPSPEVIRAYEELYREAQERARAEEPWKYEGSTG